jgi:hypothetical protein
MNSLEVGNIRDEITQNLLEKFEKVREKKEIDLNQLPIIHVKENRHDVLNEIKNKINFYKQRVNYIEGCNNIFENKVKSFINYFQNIFDNFKREDEIGLLKARNCYSEMEKLIYEEVLVKNNFSLFTFERLLEKINQIHENMENFNDHGKKDKIASFIENLENFAEKEINNEEPKFLDNGLNFSNKKISIYNTYENNSKSQKLSETVYLKKSKSACAERDIIYQYNNETLVNKIRKKSNQLFLRNFVIFYLIKENGIFSETYFSNFKLNYLTTRYKNFKFYSIKFCFSKFETNDNLKKYIFQCKNLFSKYVMINKEKINNDFIKICISGIGKKQSVMKRKLINLLSEEINFDCIFKISLFSNVFDVLRKSLEKICFDKNYIFHTNFTRSQLKNIINKII